MITRIAIYVRGIEWTQSGWFAYWALVIGGIALFAWMRLRRNTVIT